MAQTADDDLAARILALESGLRALQSAAGVGGTSLAARDPAALTLTGTASTVGSVPWNTAAGPFVDLLVTGGRLRIDVAANLEVYGNKCSLYVGYQLSGPTTAQALLDVAAVLAAPLYDTAMQLQDDGTGMNQLGAFGTFDVVTGLESGWYRVVQSYGLSYSSTTGAPFGTATYRRLTATRY